jgi:NADH dehydrogenase
LKERGSLGTACHGVSAVISTASSTLSRQPGDDLESVDRHGQIALVETARRAGVRHFTFFGLKADFGDSPLVAAKQSFEEAVRASGMAWTNLVGHMFMEIWLSPVVGFDYPHGRVTYFGSGHVPHRWVSSRDLAQAAVSAHQTPAAANHSFEACGPEALSQRQVVAMFEAASGRKFESTQVPEEVLVEQARADADPLRKTFALLQLACARGVEMNPDQFVETFGLRLTRVEDYVREVTS